MTPFKNCTRSSAQVQVKDLTTSLAEGGDLNNCKEQVVYPEQAQCKGEAAIPDGAEEMSILLESPEK